MNPAKSASKSSTRRKAKERVLLVQPKYYTRYPSLGLLKLSSLHKARGDSVEYHDDLRPADTEPTRIYLSSLFTYSWKPVHDAAAFYRDHYPNAWIELGGVYATLMPEHARLADVSRVHEGLMVEADGYRPDYDLVPSWQSSIMFGTRGCIRKCAFCAVPKLEGKVSGPAQSVKGLIDPRHKEVVLWDNNVLGVPNWRELVDELAEVGLKVDFNQGLDARLIDVDVAHKLRKLKINPVRMAYDIPSEKRALERAVPALAEAGFSRRKMHVYTLYNFRDSPEEFLGRVIDLLRLGVVSYPMRYEPLNSLVKNKFISPHWTPEKLEMVAKARRVLGYGGAFPPYRALIEKLESAKSFENAFELRHNVNDRPRVIRPAAGTVEPSTPGLEPHRAVFRELLNDPSTLHHSVTCTSCAEILPREDRAFAVQDYAGQYVEYVCPNCHPNRKWINGLWRSVLGDKFNRNGQIGRELPIEVLSRTVH